jgi:hypothetical protein
MATAELDEEEKKKGEESRLEEILMTLRCNQNSIEEMKRILTDLLPRHPQQLYKSAETPGIFLGYLTERDCIIKITQFL